MTLNTAFTLASQVFSRSGRVTKWPFVVAGALAAASAIDLATGFSLTIPDEVIAEVEAVVHPIDERESQKKAASLEELPARQHPACVSPPSGTSPGPHRQARQCA